MPSIVDTPRTTQDRNPEVTSPDWNVVPFEVGCARCGQDLRGLSEPKCPSCGLEFDWSKAVPIERLTCRRCHYHLYGLRETRCPECGEPFTWKEVLDDYHRRQKPHFEYRWRERPFRSLLYTWWLALRPWKLWRTIDIHDPPRRGALLAMALAAMICFLASHYFLSGVEAWLWNWKWSISGRWGAGGVVPWWARFGDLPRFILRDLSSPFVLKMPATVAAWWLSSFAALLVFQQSMRMCRVRSAHVLRVCVYALTPGVALVTVGVYAVKCTALWWTVSLYPEFTGTSLVLLFWLYAAWSLRYGYRNYMRMPHSVAVAASSQVIAFLCTTIAHLSHTRIFEYMGFLR